eukprot:4547-Heterococcus_DN1.PRE.1
MLFSARAYVLDTKAAVAPLDKHESASNSARHSSSSCNGTVQTNGPALHSYSSVLSIDEVTAVCRALSYAVVHAMLHANHDDRSSAGTAAAAAATSGGGYADSSSNCGSRHSRAEAQSD